MRIVIYSDSMARARPDLDEENRTYYNETYGVLLRQKIAPEHEVDIVQIESLDTIDAVVSVNPLVSFKNPDIVIFHIGLNDCAPRIFKKGSFLAKMIYDNKFFNKLTKNILPRIIYRYRYQITKVIHKHYVPLKIYGDNMSEMINRIRILNPNTKFYTISILPSELLAKKSYGVIQNIMEYNQKLKEIFKENYIDINKIDLDKKTINDGIHMTKKMHKLVYQLIYEKMENILCVE